MEHSGCTDSQSLVAEFLKAFHVLVIAPRSFVSGTSILVTDIPVMLIVDRLR